MECLTTQPSRGGDHVPEYLSEQCGLVSEMCSSAQQVQIVNHQLTVVQRDRRQCQQQCRMLYNKLDVSNFEKIIMYEWADYSVVLCQPKQTVLIFSIFYPTEATGIKHHSRFN